ncbi:alpha-rhamnosidase [Mucilaginibacter sp. Bleaf8]|uniref:alpha-L-rhamnosidase-related protein n=1 Tax=Mucilaginibacter sp. Bleaf8 TaxID=2834430 RepID=UPI001BD12975|nr:alpha-L-rhamnosidase C-terminal domain-containing protein [Mucilaginibacter sp. Bleaf8]MBS7564912.1 alpha-rhamnosidase [Mucilaginibacter sp. Bleaf8]
MTVKLPISLKKYLIALVTLWLAFGADVAQAQSKATWIWYPGDYEIWLSNKMQNRRTERGSFFPPFWKLDSHYVLIDFHKDFELAAPEEAEIAVEGQYNLKLDGKAISGYPKQITLPAGKHRISLKVYNQGSVPAVFVKSAHLVSDTSWRVTFEDKEWIDASGKTSDISATQYLSAGAWNFNEASAQPSTFRLPTVAQQAVSQDKQKHFILVDFGKETFGYIKLQGVKGKGRVTLYYGESKEEALDTQGGELLDRIDVDQPQIGDITLDGSRAFRYVNVQYDDAVDIDKVSMLYEYAPVQQRGSFSCSDDQINKIWQVSAYTMQLNTREFFIDGIKRDRWVWSGDAYQSYLMNYYLYFDSPTVTRTLAALRGKDPVTSHVNTIMDYTFYWFIGIYDYYQYTGDKTFIQQFYPRMQSLMNYCLSRRNKDGMMEGLTGDWVFIDWADGLSKQGEVSFEQLLLARSLETMALCANIMHDGKGAILYNAAAKDLKAKLFAYYWNPQKHALVHSRINGKPTDNVTRYANMFSIFFNYFTKVQKQDVKKYVLLNNSIPKITTPYMRFYELEALCAMGEQNYVLQQMKDYWGGMLNLGATSFWEEYNPDKKGAEHYAMYGRPFGKSLCHAWGASPIYLLGKYYLGVKPTAPGYAHYLIEPQLGGLQWVQGAVPTPAGDIQVYCNRKQIKVNAANGMGTLRFKSKAKPVCKGATFNFANGYYEMTVQPGKNYTVNYSAL